MEQQIYEPNHPNEYIEDLNTIEEILAELNKLWRDDFRENPDSKVEAAILMLVTCLYNMGYGITQHFELTDEEVAHLTFDGSDLYMRLRFFEWEKLDAKAKNNFSYIICLREREKEIMKEILDKHLNGYAPLRFRLREQGSKDVMFLGTITGGGSKMFKMIYKLLTKSRESKILM